MPENTFIKIVSGSAFVWFMFGPDWGLAAFILWCLVNLNFSTMSNNKGFQ